MRKPVVAGATVLGLAFASLLVWRQYMGPFPLGVPTDHALVELFHAHRQTFEVLAKMADEDAPMASSNASETLALLAARNTVA